MHLKVKNSCNDYVITKGTCPSTTKIDYNEHKPTMFKKKNYLHDMQPIHACANDVEHQEGAEDPAKI